MSSFNPIRRTPIKPKAKQHKESAPWRPQRIRLNGREMAELRHEVFGRSNGQCEKCFVFAGWYEGQMHHKVKRSQGGSDTAENLAWLCPKCHRIEHGTASRRSR